MIKTLAHALMGGIFIFAGSNSFMHPEYIAPKVEKAGISQARQASILNGAIMVVAGTALAAGIFPKLAALALAGALLPTTYIGHAFWNEEKSARTGDQIQFLKNSAMLGGLLLVMAEKND